MDIVELVEIALANSRSRRVDVAALESAELTTEVVSGLAQIISELVDNAIAFSEPQDKVRVTGLFEEESYLILISDRGIGIPDELIAQLNDLLQDPDATAGPDPRMGIAHVARLAVRNGIEVRLVPGVPGTTARVTVPPRFVTPGADRDRPQSEVAPGRRLAPRQPFARPQSDSDQILFSSGPLEGMVDPERAPNRRRGTGVVAMSQEARREAEAFLERVFGPLIEGPETTRNASRRAATNGNSHLVESELSPDPARGEPVRGTVTSLRTRVPGKNFSVVEDQPSTVAAERAIDIRSALAKFNEGRRAAIEKDGDQ